MPNLTDENREAYEVMLGQSAVLGIKVDPAWSVEDLAQKIIDAQLADKAKSYADFQKAKKVKIRVKRDAWPLEDMKVPAGKTCDVPVELAQRWFEAGVCEPAEPFAGFADK